MNEIQDAIVHLVAIPIPVVAFVTFAVVVGLVFLRDAVWSE
jgi:hypothetical protein